MKPSDFNTYPWNSVCQESESETVAKNIMIILKKLGDSWKDLNWDEYKALRLIDGNFSEIEKKYFDKVIGYCKSADTAVLFSPEWAKVSETTKES